MDQLADAGWAADDTKENWLRRQVRGLQKFYRLRLGWLLSNPEISASRQMNNAAYDQHESKAATKLVKALDWVYAKAINGMGVEASVEDMARDYSDHGSIDNAIDSLISYQVCKASTAGFVTGLGGLITLPAAVPANLASAAYVQLRMITTIACLRGYDIRSDQVKTMAFACLCGAQFTNALKEAGVQIGRKTLLQPSNENTRRVIEED